MMRRLDAADAAAAGAAPAVSNVAVVSWCGLVFRVRSFGDAGDAEEAVVREQPLLVRQVFLLEVRGRLTPSASAAWAVLNRRVDHRAGERRPASLVSAVGSWC